MDETVIYLNFKSTKTVHPKVYCTMSAMIVGTSATLRYFLQWMELSRLYLLFLRVELEERLKNSSTRFHLNFLLAACCKKGGWKTRQWKIGTDRFIFRTSLTILENLNCYRIILNVKKVQLFRNWSKKIMQTDILYLYNILFYCSHVMSSKISR